VKIDPESFFLPLVYGVSVMDDFSKAQITIGGPIDGHLIPALCEAISGERLSLPSEIGPFAPASEAQLLAARQLVRDHWVLRMNTDHAHYGKIQTLELFLIDHRIAFDRRTWGHHDFGASIVFYRPETGREVWPIDREGTMLMEAAPVWEAYGQLQSARSDGPMFSRRVDDICAELRQYLPTRAILPDLQFHSLVCEGHS
jgi:hypothetical protein